MAEFDQLPTEVSERLGLSGTRLVPMPGDASSRRYARVDHPEFGPALLLVDTPGTPHFDNFLLIGAHLADLGLSAPRIFAALREEGLALIEDFGDATYTNLLRAGADEGALYDQAVDTLIAWHATASATDIALPSYDMERLLEEVDRFADWFAPVIQPGLPESFGTSHKALWREALAGPASRRDALVLRDYHVDNLLLLEDRSGPARCGLLDFQDGLIGARAYDLVSLTQDARRDLSPGLEKRCLDRYLAAAPDSDAFLTDYWRLGAQRHAKIAGNFQRLSLRDGKHQYLAYLPRVLRLLDQALTQAGLDEIKDLYDSTLPGWTSWTPG